MRRRPRWLAWWYLSIALGFALLAIYHVIAHDRFWQIAIRLILAAAFALLAKFEFGGGMKR
jgi:hypothetical protein